MASNSKHLGIWAPGDRWALLGKLLRAWRRTHLGYRYRPAFARDRIPLTLDGNLNIRLVQDIENNLRPNTYPAETLEAIAGYYGVGWESVLAVLGREADALAPAAPLAPVTQLPPVTGAARIAANRRFYDEIKGRLDLLEARGVTAPSGRQLFPDAPDDAKTWDGIGARLDTDDDRAWFIADLRRREDARKRNGAGNGEQEVTPG